MFDNIRVIAGPLILSSPTDVDEAEAQLGIHFPAGYREYVTRFGDGFLEDFIRIIPPHHILYGPRSTAEWRQLIKELDWFWDDGGDVLTKNQALQCVWIGATLIGDDLIIHPDNPERIYVLPRHSETIYVAGDGLPAAIEWICSSGMLVEPFSERRFVPFASSADG